MRIAVCDDEKVFLDNICNDIETFYKSLDIICVPFYDGKEVILAFENGQRFDAIFLDVEMKQLDGMKTADRIKTTKSDKKEHGFGIGNVDRAVQKCGGEFQLDCKKAGEKFVFSAEVMLPLRN